jgi:hypothetical protein
MMTLKTILLMVSLLAASLLLQAAHAESAVPAQVRKQQTSQSVLFDI